MSLRITLGGEAATGKTDVAKALAERLSLKVVSVGDFMRARAAERNITIEQLAKEAGQSSLDYEADEWAREYALTEDNFVFEGRLTWWTVKNADLKVLLQCNIDTRAIRRSGQIKRAFKVAKQLILERDEADRKRFQEVYQIENFLDPNHYDFPINTAPLTIEGVVDVIIESPQFAKLRPARANA